MKYNFNYISEIVSYRGKENTTILYPEEVVSEVYVKGIWLHVVIKPEYEVYPYATPNILIERESYDDVLVVDFNNVNYDVVLDKSAEEIKFYFGLNSDGLTVKLNFDNALFYNEPEEPEEPVEPEEPEEPVEPNEDSFISNYNIVNAYADTSYIDIESGTVLVSSFSSDGDNKQEVTIYNTIRITANDGYQFDLDNLEEYYFDVQFQRMNNALSSPIYNGSLPFTRVNLSEFEPVTDISTYEWIERFSTYPLYQGINTDGSMFYTFTVGDTKHLILLYGGLRERDLVFFTFTKGEDFPNHRVAFTMDGEDWVSTDIFSADIHDYDTGNDKALSFLNNLNFVAIPSTSSPIEDTSKYLFNTYYINNEDLSILKENSGLVSDVIINTYSFPLNFADEDLVEVDFSVANITQSIPAKRFLKNNTEVEIFKFTIPDIPDVTEVRVRIPFNNDVVLNYEDVKGKTITGRFVYEILTNTTTLFINDGVIDIYKVMVGVGVTVPYKPTGQYTGGNDPTTRLSVDKPKLLIKGVGKTIKGNYIQGMVRNVINDMLNSERDTLNSLLKDGVFYND